MKTILTLFMTIIFSIVQGQTYTFQKLCYTDTNTIFNELTPVSGGYMACGTDGSGGYLLVKMDAAGQTIWSKNLGISTAGETGYRVGEITGGGYYLLGTTTSYSTNTSQVNLIKLDANGNILWNKIYTGINFIDYPSLRQTSTGGFIISAAYHYGAGNDFYLFINIDGNGNVLWSKSFAESTTSAKLECFDVETNWGNNRFTVVGKGGGGIGLFAVSCDVAGNLIWAKKYTNINNSAMYGRAIAKTSDGGYAIACQSAYGNSPMMVKIDGNGNFIWAKSYKLANDTALNSNPAFSVRQTTDGGFILGTFYSSYPMLIKTNSSGHFQWSKYYTLGNDINQSWPFLLVKQAPDKGYVMGLTSNDTTSFSGLGWIIKTDSLGVTGCPETSVILSDSIEVLNTTNGYVDTLGMVANVASYYNVNAPMSYSTICTHTFTSQDTITTFVANKIGDKNSIKVFPNPSAGEFTIQKGSLEIKSILIYNVQGETIYETFAVPADKPTVNINLTSRSKGVYILKVFSTQGATYSRLIIQ